MTEDVGAGAGATGAGVVAAGAGLVAAGTGAVVVLVCPVLVCPAEPGSWDDAPELAGTPEPYP
jgi:hypothetical protein